MNRHISLWLRAALIVLTVVFVAVPGGWQDAHAQDPVVEINYDDWTAVANRAEAAISAAQASTATFEGLRSEIAAWREKFLQRQKVNTARIETLRSQIKALGPAPEEGQTEAEEIALRRKELNAQLAEATAPIKRAEEAFSRAEGLIREIDQIIRERQANALLKLGPTPVNPALWPEAATQLSTSLRAMVAEVTSAWASEVKMTALRGELPVILFYVLIALILLARGRAVMERMTGLVLETAKGRIRALAGFAASLGQIIVPVLGIFLMTAAIRSTGLVGLRGQVILDNLPQVGISIFGARWLGLRLFPKRMDITHILPTTAADARFMRLYATSLGVITGLFIILKDLSDYETYSEAVNAVLFLPLTGLAGLILFRMGAILLRTMRSVRADTEGGGPAVFGVRFLALTGRAAVIVSLAGILLGVAGYLNASLFLVMPTAYTLALLGLLLVLQDQIREVYAIATGTETSQARDALAPTLLNLLLVLLSLPVFALIWGARFADLTELWARFKAGVTIGGTTISPANFLTFAVVFCVLYAATRLLQGALRTSVLPKTKIDPGGQNAIISGIGYIGIFLAGMVAITTAGIDLSSLAIVAGALSIGIGFGLQNIVSNFVSGIILLIERPISLGDWIEVGGHMGIVKDISVRSTRIETFDRVDVIIPNADFVSGTVQNWTRGNVIGRVKVPVGVAYGTDTRRVERILKEIAMEHPLVTMTPEPGIDFMGFGADSLDFQIRAVIRDVNFSVSVKTELNHRIAERFAEEGIEIPFAQRDVWLRNPEALRTAAAPKDSARPSNLTIEHTDETDMGLEGET